MHDEFSTLLVAARAGDQPALGKLLFRKFDELTAFVNHKIRIEQALNFEAEDIVQQTLTEASQKIGSVESETQEGFYGWLCAIANSRFLDAVRAQNAKKRGGNNVKREADWYQNSNDSVVATFDRLAGSSTTPSRIISLGEKVSALRIRLAQLPQHYRDAIVFKDIQELSRAESAAKMGKSEDEFRGILMRARNQLRTLLGDASQYITHK